MSAAVACIGSQYGWSAPAGGIVASGNAAIQTTPSVTLIQQSTSRAVIDWRSFNIDKGEAVSFLQPSRSAATLNRIHDALPSEILGQINANGQIFLVNPNGFVFGKTSTINVGSLVASTADIANPDFMAGRMIFSSPGNIRAAIVNEGSITAAPDGFVALAAPNVRNSGVISAQLGRISLASGDSFSLDLYGDNLISVAIDRDALAALRDTQGTPLTRYIGQDGSILADGGRIDILAASAQNLLAATVNLGGVMRARSAQANQGVIYLAAGPGGDVAINGQIDASTIAGGTGGDIEVVGATVSVLSGAQLNASGTNGGGNILLGDFAATEKLSVAPGAILAANAIGHGNGGAIRLLSSGQTTYSGTLSATGGPTGGNGGSAEISSVGTLLLQSADIKLSAPYGQPGTILLDPTDLTIAHQPDSANVVSDFTIYNLLAAGNNLSLSATHDLNVLAAIEGRGGVAGGSVSLDAGHDLLVKDNILTNNGAITLTAGNLLSMDPNTMLYAGNQPVSIAGGAAVSTQYIVTTGNVSLTSAGPINAAQPLGFSSGGQDFPIGTLTVNGLLDSAVAAPIQTVSLNGVFATGAVTVNGYSLSDSSGIKSGAAVTLSAAEKIALTHDLVAPGGISLTSIGSDIAVQTLDGSANGGNGAISLKAAGDITVGGGVRATNADYTAHTTGGSYTSDSGIDVGSGTVEIESAGNLELQSIQAGTITLTTTGANGSIRLNATAPGSTEDNVIRLNAAAGNHIALNAGRDINVNARIDGSAANPGSTIALMAANDLNLANSISSNNGAVSLSAGNLLSMAAGRIVSAGNQTISLVGTQGVTAEYLQTTGTLNLSSSNGGITANRALVAGTVNINADLGSPNTTITPSAEQTVSLNGVQTSGAVLANAFSLTDDGGIDAGADVTLHTVQGVTLSEYVLSGGNIVVHSQGGALSAKGFDTREKLGGGISLAAGSNISVSENVLTNNSAINAEAATGSLQISGAISAGTAAATLTAAGDLQVDSLQAANLSATTTATGSITVNSPMGFGGDLQNVTLNSSQDITLNGVQVANGLTAHFHGNLNVLDNIFATNGSTIELGAPGNANTSGKINLHADILSEGGDIRLNNDLEVFNFRDLNSASAFQALSGYPTHPAAIHMVSDSTGGDGDDASFKSLIFIDNTLANRAGIITLNMSSITNHSFNDDVNGKTSLNRLVISASKDTSDVQSLTNTGNIGAGDAITYPTGGTDNIGRYAQHLHINGSFFTDGNLPEIIYRPSASVRYFEALNQYGYFYSRAGAETYRLVISAGTVPSVTSQHAANWLGQFKDPGQGGQNPVLSQPTPVDASFSEFAFTPGSPGQSQVSSPGVVGPPSIGIPPTVGNGNVALALSLAVPGAVFPGNPNSPPTPPSPTAADTMFRASDLFQIGSGMDEGEGDSTSANGVFAPGEDIVLGGPGILAEADFGRGTPLVGAAQEVFKKRRCLALAAAGISAQPCVGASR